MARVNCLTRRGAELYRSWTTEWHCKQPPSGVSYEVIREDWTRDGDGMVWQILEISYKPLKVVMHGE